MTRPCLFIANENEKLAGDLRANAARGLAAVRNATLLAGLKAVIQTRAVPGDWMTVAAFDLVTVAETVAQQYREQLPLGSRIEFRVARLQS